MDINDELFTEFKEFVSNCLQDTLETTIQTIENHSLFKYGSPIDKQNVLNDLKYDFAGEGFFNFMDAKGVVYKNGKFEIHLLEFVELVKYCGVNLESRNFGLFQNENDKEKPPAYKSYSQFLVMISYCLQLQIISEYENRIFKNKVNKKKYISSDEYDHPIFLNKKTEDFFNYLFEKWLNVNEKPLSSISIIYKKLRYQGKENDVDYSLKPIKQGTFAEYWNRNYAPQHQYKYHLPLKKDGTISFKNIDLSNLHNTYVVQYNSLKRDFK